MTSPEAFDLPGIDTEWVCDQYEAARRRLPEAPFPAHSERAARLFDLVDRFDVFLLDAFGVLNVGNTAISGASETVEAIRAAGKRALVLTNGATAAPAEALARIRAWGFDFQTEDVIASRDIVTTALRTTGQTGTWGIAAPPRATIEQLPGDMLALHEDPAPYEAADAFLFLSTSIWTPRQQQLLRQSLRDRPRPLWIANPDVVAPREAGFSLEPGYFAHRLADELGLDPVFFGKPFPNAFDTAFERLGGQRPPPERIVMVGDSLHTDILGGAAAGLKTVLVQGHGLFRNDPPERFIEASGIVPDYIVQTT